MSIELVMSSNHLILCCSLLLLLSIFPSIRVSSNELVLCIRWPKYWSFSFSWKKYSGLISFRMDWLDLLAVQGTLRSLLQHHSAKASILQCSAFFIVQLSHPYTITGKTIGLTRWTFVGKVSLLLNMLSMLVIAFLPRNKSLCNFQGEKMLDLLPKFSETTGLMCISWKHLAHPFFLNRKDRGREKKREEEEKEEEEERAGKERGKSCWSKTKISALECS